jgi:hypothetical protein
MAYGFIPLGGIDGRPYNGGTMRCVKLAADATAIYPGDFVRQNGTADVNGQISVTKVAAGEVILGAVVSVEPTEATSLPFAAASAATDRYLNVAVATDGMLFKCQPATAIAVADIGGNADISVSAGVAPFYTSKSSILGNGSYGIATAQLNLLGVIQDSASPTSTSANLIVRVAEPQIGGATVSVGV